VFGTSPDQKKTPVSCTPTGVFAFQKPYRASGEPAVANNNAYERAGYHDAKLNVFLKTPAAREKRM
jgi:hypothetical protein